MTLFRNKYRIESARLKHWNYANAGAYFITICTHNREHFFGEIVGGEMHLNELGKIVEAEWLKTPIIRPDMNLSLGEFVVMPNHFHGILIIGENEFNTNVEAQCIAPDMDIPNVIDTQCIAYPHNQQNQFGPQRKNAVSILRGFKSAVTIQARQMQPDFAWQPLFHDHIIRNHDEYVRIENYIINNPQNWTEDNFFIQ